jgi:3-oxoacyl-[acyl-carrier-protein] synthase II
VAVTPGHQRDQHGLEIPSRLGQDVLRPRRMPLVLDAFKDARLNERTQPRREQVVNPEPTGAGQVRAMRLALADAGLDASDVAHVNVHATSTPVGDAIEARAIRDAVGTGRGLRDEVHDRAPLGAAGALEALITVLSVHNGVVPPTPTLENPNDELDLTRQEPRTAAITAALSNSFGFGGHNAALAFRA